MSIEFEQNFEAQEQEKEPASCQELLDEYNHRCETEGKPVGEILNVELTNPGSKVTEITAPIDDGDGREVVAGELTVYNPAQLESGLVAARVEPRDNHDSEIVFFDSTIQPNKLIQIPDAPVLKLEDPFVTTIGNKKLIGGVETYEKPGGILEYRTVIYPYQTSIEELQEQGGTPIQPIIEGPVGMKGIRPVELPDGRVGVFTRPQGKHGGRGKIGYLETGSLELSENQLERAEIIDGLFRDDEWGGVNEAKAMADGRIKVLGHIARLVENSNGSEPKKEYYPVTFIFDPTTRTTSELKIIATPDCLPKIKSKIPELDGVMYPGGLKENPDNTATLWVGGGDSAAGTIHLPKDPFAEVR
jgi:hypothetical protein